MCYADQTIHPQEVKAQDSSLRNELSDSLGDYIKYYSFLHEVLPVRTYGLQQLLVSCFGKLTYELV